MMRRTRSKIFAGLLAGILSVSVLFTGCGGSGQDGFGLLNGIRPENNAENSGSNMSTGSGAGSNLNITALTKGRYAEQEIPFEENSVMQMPAHIYARDNGLYLLDVEGFDARVDLQAAEPKAANIRQSDLPKPLYEHFKAEHYLTQMVMAENGARMYTRFVLDDEDGGKYHEEKFFLGADGVEKRWDADGALSYYYLGDDGYFYVLVKAGAGDYGKLYRVDSESGESKYLMDFSELGSGVISIQVFGGRLFAATYDQMVLYDLNTLEKLEEDKVLNELLDGAITDGNGDYANGYLLCPGPDDSVYVATNRGLYRHVLYGNISELLIDGTLTSLGDISKLYADMYVDEKGENGMPVFYLLYDTGKLVKFAYDPELPVTPQKTIVLYSLIESDDIRLVISSYQALHPEVYVRYEISMSGRDGATRQDALNSLATRIAAGEGPDILLLDDLPYSSYVQKGVLADLSGLYAKLAGEQHYFDNIIGALYRGDKLYTLPMMFAVPILVGDKGTLAGITDSESMVRTVENSPVKEDALRIGFWDPQTTLRCMSYTCSGDWLGKDGGLDKEALKRFLKICKRVYEADIADCSKEKMEARQSARYDFGDSYLSREWYRRSTMLGSCALDMTLYGNAFAMGLMSGNISSEFNYNYAVIEKAKSDYMVMPGVGKTAIPFAMLGINAATPIPEAAEDFVRYALTDYLRETKYLTGIPINRDVLLDMERNNPNPAGNEVSYGISFEGEDEENVYISIDAPWRDMAVYEEYNAMLDTLDSVNICEYELLSAVLENGIPALTGEKTIEETVDAIAKKVQLYLAE